ncbi:uncharacterized protein LOC143153933 isoform X2 [Ptiloglossa arizonensis]|uniref:uncharacterized protein LOC143153933 isoform X2 n=1 Tax=Ptiloglossa arizonensis TaxID=3350558 RepID=UPI003FA104C2
MVSLDLGALASFPTSESPLCGQVIKLDCGQFRPAGANALLHVKHLCPWILANLYASRTGLCVHLSSLLG